MAGYFDIDIEVVSPFSRETDKPPKIEYQLKITVTSFDGFKGDVEMAYSTSGQNATLSKQQAELYVPEDGSVEDDVTCTTNGAGTQFRADGTHDSLQDYDTEDLPV